MAALVPLLGVNPASAATGGQYLAKATDPHGNVWLSGTVDGTTTGAMDPGTNPDAASYGHVWTTDVPSGFCRILPAVTTTDPATLVTTVTPASLDRNTPGGCIITGGKAGTPTLDPRRNADGTFFVYTPDWAARSSGVYRMTYDPGSQTMTKSELLAPNRYPFDNKPFGTALGADNKLYVSNDLNGNVARFSGVNGPTSTQTVETSVAKSSDGTRVRALTFVCWSNLSTLNGGKGAARSAGAPGCTPGDPAPDLVLAQKSSLAVVLNAETCQAAAGGCTTIPVSVAGAPAGPKVLTPMGLRTDPANPTVFYTSDSPGNITRIERYNINTDVQDSYANFGLLDDGTLSQLSFAFSVGFDPQHAMYIGDDPAAGATAFQGRYFRLGPNAPADVLGRPGVPATAPPMPPIGPPGALNGGTFGATTAPVGFTAPTLPADGVWMPGQLGGHLWLPDPLRGLCRMDVPAGGTLALENNSTCMIGAAAGGLLKPEQSAFDAGKNLLYVADGGSKSIGVVRFHFDPATETLNTPQVVAPGLSGTGNGLDGQRADAVALDPLTDSLYVGFRARNLAATTQLARVPGASIADTATQNVEFVAKTTRSTPAFGLALIVNPAVPGAPANSDLYIADGKGVDLITNVAGCAPGACTSILALNVRAPKGFATDGKGVIYMASPPAPGTGTTTTAVTRFTIANGAVDTYSTTGTNPDATQQAYGFVFSLALDPAGNLYVADNPDAVVPPGPTNAAHVWKVSSGVTGPAQPSLTSKPGDPTNHNNSTAALAPSFSFAATTPGGTFRCSLVSTGTPDAYAPCTSPFTPPATTRLADGSWTFKVLSVDAAGTTSTPTVYTFTVNTVAPVLTLTAGQTSPSKVNTPSWTFSSSKPSTTFSCSLSTGADAFSPCGSPQTYPAQPDGAYTFKVTGTDLAGNTSAAASSMLTIDTVAPVVTASPAGGAYPTAQTVTLTANEPATIRYTTDGTIPTAASTTYTAPISIATSTILKYVATDPAGNSSTAVSQAYTIGSVSLDSKPASPTANSTPTFTFSAPGVTAPTFSCALTTAAPGPLDFTACTSPKTYGTPTALTANGSYIFTVQGTSGAGASVGSATTNLVLDAAAPALTSNPPNPSTTSTETFAFTKAQPTGWTFQCSLVATGAADAFAACTSPDNHPNTADGAYTYKVKAVDGDGVASTTQVYGFSVTAGAAIPTTTMPVQGLLVPEGPVSTTTVPVTLTWIGSANATAYELQQSTNGGSFLDLPGGSCSLATPCSTPTAVVNDRPSATNQSAVTTYRYQARAQNSAGTWGPYTADPAFSIPVTDNTGGFSFNGGWSGVNLTGAYNGSVHQSSTGGAFATNSTGLSGSTVGWLSTTGPDRGMAAVSVDGGPNQTVDLYSPTQNTGQLVWKADNLGSANGHTIKVTVLSTKNAASTGNKVDIDAYLGLK